MRAALFNPIRTGSAFRDDFNRRDQDLTDDPRWLLAGGVSTMFAVRSEKVATTAGTDSAVSADVGSFNMYAQVKLITSSNAFVCARVIDGNNLCGARWEAPSTVTVYKRVGGTFTLLGSATITPVAGDILRVEVIGDTARALLNGTQIIAPVSLGGSVPNGERAGLRYNSATNPLFDDFECGPL